MIQARPGLPHMIECFSSVGTVKTDQDGAFRVNVQSLRMENLLLQAEYPGDEKYWPACAPSIGAFCIP